MHLRSPLLFTLTLLPTALCLPEDPAPSATLISIAYGGAGCGSLNMALSPSLFEIKATQYDLALGKDIAANRNRKNCQINLTIQLPANYSLLISRGTFSGTANLSDKVVAQVKNQVYLNLNSFVSDDLRERNVEIEWMR